MAGLPRTGKVLGNQARESAPHSYTDDLPRIGQDRPWGARPEQPYTPFHSWPLIQAPCQDARTDIVPETAEPTENKEI